MRTLIIGCGGFSLKFSAYTINEMGELISVEHVNSEDLGKYIGGRYDIDKVLLQGPTDYCLGIKDKIENSMALHYANRKIQIEVMEK